MASASSKAGGASKTEDRVRDGVLRDAPESVLGDGDDTPAQPGLGTVTCGVDDAAHVHAQRERGGSGYRDEVAEAAVDVIEVE